MGFSHHITGAAGATGLMAESARLRGSPCFGRPVLPATDIPGLPLSATRIGARPLCHAGRAAASDESQPGRAADAPTPATRFRTAKGQDH
jgi:hypothetical protein